MTRLDIPAARGSLVRVLGALLLTLGATAAGAPDAAPDSAAVDPAVTAVTSRVVPVPASVAPGGGAFRITAGTPVVVDGGAAGAGAREAARVAEYAAGLLRPATGYALPVEDVSGAGVLDDPDAAGGLVLALDDSDPGLGQEGYRLRTTPRSVLLSAGTPAGLFHAVQTLRQLLPAAVERPGVQQADWTVPGADIRDTPRYAYRGAMLDVARHFFTVDQVEHYIDDLALYKINTLHLHLTDDQGWRIAVDSWPRLASYGGGSEVGGGDGGFYTQDDYREIVAYAADHFLTVVPEIDMPAHTNAALASYAELNCDGVAPARYTGTAVGFSSLCVPKEVTYAFMDDVLREVAALTPGPYVHIGGDEAHSTTAADYVSFIDRVQPLVTGYGKTVIGWHQIDSAHPVKGAIAQYWGTKGDEAAVATAAKAGTRVIMSPANRAYLDIKYTAATKPGLSWAGLVEVQDSYDWDPATYVKNVPASAVLGVEAPLWTETLTTMADLEYMAFPRLPGIAELGWSPAASHDWTAYRTRLAAQGPRWTALGITYYRSPQVSWPAA